MDRLILDKNAYSDFMVRGIWADRLKSARRIFMPLPALAELRFGFVNGSKAESNEQRLTSFLQHPTLSVLIADETTTFHYARLRLQLVRQRTPIPVNDLWIAALATQHSLWLCTSDAHFDHLPQLLRAIP